MKFSEVNICIHHVPLTWVLPLLYGTGGLVDNMNRDLQ